MAQRDVKYFSTRGGSDDLTFEEVSQLFSSQRTS